MRELLCLVAGTLGHKNGDTHTKIEKMLLQSTVYVCMRTSSVLKNNSMGQEMSDEEIQITAAMARLRRLLIRGCSGLIMATYL